MNMPKLYKQKRLKKYYQFCMRYVNLKGLPKILIANKGKEFDNKLIIIPLSHIYCHIAMFINFNIGFLPFFSDNL